ncbi:MAG TPA: hypothetical protein VJ549_00905 [Geothrix sp.]|nr:hypothetical protein [Geothrix sp.]
MLIYFPPFVFEAPTPTAELPLLPGSDPMILETYKWTLAHSPSLQELVKKLALADRKAKYRLCPGLEPNYGKIVIHPTAEDYHIDIQVPTTPWARYGDALEPWIASALFLACEIAVHGAIRDATDSYCLVFYKKSEKAAFAFQKEVRKEIEHADPVRLQNLGTGLELFHTSFKSILDIKAPPQRRPLPKIEP